MYDNLPSRQSDVETTSKQRQSMSSNRRRKVVENANGIDVEISTLFRRIVIDVASTSEYRRRFHVTFSTSYQRRITVENANGRRWNVDVISTYMFWPKFDAKMNAPAFLNYKCLISYEKHSCCKFFWNIYSHIYIIGLDTDNYDTITLNLHDYTPVTYA